MWVGKHGLHANGAAAALVVGVGLTVAGLIAVGEAEAAVTAPASLQGETLSGRLSGPPHDAGACAESSSDGTVTFEVNDGQAFGPYPGTFSERGTLAISASGS